MMEEINACNYREQKIRCGCPLAEMSGYPTGPCKWFGKAEEPPEPECRHGYVIDDDADRSMCTIVKYTDKHCRDCGVKL